ncbi:MAG: T9SS type A sorting domain-containing protein [Bacteroidota bacterium]
MNIFLTKVIRENNLTKYCQRFVAAFLVVAVLIPFTAYSQLLGNPKMNNPIDSSTNDQRNSASASDGNNRSTLTNNSDISLTGYILSQNYPNPSNPVSAINYEIPLTSHVLLTIVDAMGNKIRDLVNRNQAAGKYTVSFSTIQGTTNLSSGVYFYRLEAGEFTATKKLILLK